MIINWIKSLLDTGSFCSLSQRKTICKMAKLRQQFERKNDTKNDTNFSQQLYSTHYHTVMSAMADIHMTHNLLQWINVIQHFLADRTNGRANVTLLRLSSSSVCCLSVTLCIVAKRCVLEQKLLLRAYRKLYMRNRLVPKWMTLTFV